MHGPALPVELTDTIPEILTGHLKRRSDVIDAVRAVRVVQVDRVHAQRYKAVVHIARSRAGLTSMPQESGPVRE